MIFAPIIFLIIQVGITRAAGFHFGRLTWSLSVLFAFLSVIGIVFLVPFLPMQVTVYAWKPVEFFNVSLEYELQQAQWKILLAILALYFSAIVYHPGQRHIKRIFRADRYALTVIPAVLAVISADIFSASVAVLLFDIILFIFSGSERNPVYVKQEIFSRSLSILLLLGSAVLSRVPLLRTGQPNGTESIGTWLLLAAVTVRLAFQKFTEEKSEKGYEYRIFSNFLNSAMSLSLLQISGFMQGNIAGKGLVIIITTAILISGIPALLSNRDNAIFFKAFSVYVAGLTLLIISLDPLHSGECVLMGVIILLCGAGVVFLQPYYKESHKIPVAIFAAMLIGMPFTPSGLWAVSWAGIAGIGPSVVFMILIPVFIAVLVFTLYQYREVSLQSWPDQEVITRALHIAGPVVPLVSAVVVSIWNGPGFTGLLPWSMMALVAGLVLVISRVRIRLMESINQIASRIPKLKLDKTVVIVGNLEQSIQRSMEEIENFLEGENSFLWIMLVLVVVALFNWR